MKVCGRCKEVKTPADFAKAAGRPDGLQFACRDCNKAYRQANRDKLKGYMRKYYHEGGGKDAMISHNYGVPRGWYAAKLAEQEGRCAICHQEQKLVVDHDHATGAVRDLLCSTCNRALGIVEKTKWLIHALAYLYKHLPED